MPAAAHARRVEADDREPVPAPSRSVVRMPDRAPAAASGEAWPPDPRFIDLDDGSWLTPQQAAAAARVDERTIRRWIATKGIAVKTVGGRVWVNKGRLFAPVRPTCPNSS